MALAWLYTLQVFLERGVVKDMDFGKEGYAFWHDGSIGVVECRKLLESFAKAHGIEGEWEVMANTPSPSRPAPHFTRSSLGWRRKT